MKGNVDKLTIYFFKLLSAMFCTFVTMVTGSKLPHFLGFELAAFQKQKSQTLILGLTIYNQIGPYFYNTCRKKNTDTTVGNNP